MIHDSIRSEHVSVLWALWQGEDDLAPEDLSRVHTVDERPTEVDFDDDAPTEEVPVVAIDRRSALGTVFSSRAG